MRWSRNFIEQEISINKAHESDQLQRFEALPPQAKTHDPNQERAERVSRTPTRRADRPRDRQREIIEHARENHAEQPSPPDTWMMRDLPPSHAHVQRAPTPRGGPAVDDMSDELAGRDYGQAGDAFPADQFQWLDRVARHDSFFEDELAGGQYLRGGNDANAQRRSPRDGCGILRCLAPMTVAWGGQV